MPTDPPEEILRFSFRACVAVRPHASVMILLHASTSGPEINMAESTFLHRGDDKMCIKPSGLLLWMKNWVIDGSNPIR